VGQVLGLVVLQPLHDAEAVAQGRGQQPGARGGADQGERRQVELDGARRRPLADHDVELEVLHRRVQHLLHHRAQPVDLVDEQHVAGLEVGQQRGEVAGFSSTGPGGLAQGHPISWAMMCASVVLPSPGRAEDQRVVQRLAATAGGADEDLHLLAHRRLADVLAE
jgi:hypothetical protein